MSLNYTIYVCPDNTYKTPAIEYQQLSDDLVSSSGSNPKVITISLQPNYLDLNTNEIVNVEICPDGGACLEGCDKYKTELTWDVTSWLSYNPHVRWEYPNFCNLRIANLRYYRTDTDWGFLMGSSITEGANPTIIYPDGSLNNSDCMGCGLNTLGEQEYLHLFPLPGTKYTLQACVEDVGCGNTNCNDYWQTTTELASSVFETDGVTGGEVVGVEFDDDLKLLYTIRRFIKSGNYTTTENIQCYSNDFFAPAIGEYVLLSKIGCDSVRNFYTDADLNSDNYCNGSSFKILANTSNYAWQG